MLSSLSNDRSSSLTTFFICICGCKSSISLMQPFICAGVSRTCLWWYLGSLLSSGIGGRTKVQAGLIHSLPSQKSHLVPCFPSHSNFKYPHIFYIFSISWAVQLWISSPANPSNIILCSQSNAPPSHTASATKLWPHSISFLTAVYLELSDTAQDNSCPGSLSS